MSPLRRLLHWGPLAVLVIIKLITWMTIHCLGMWWPPWKSAGGTLNSMVFLFLAGCTLYFFLNAMWEGPGYVPIGWRPEKEEDIKFLQYCMVCNGYKAPRSHHCKKCGRCIKKMDHHCPWINGCVGFANHRNFTYFLFFAVLGCAQATLVLSICLYHAINRVHYVHYGTGNDPMIYLTVSTLLLSLFALGMAIGVVLAVGVLFYFQMRSILQNQTNIEDWIVEKANNREDDGGSPFVFPYDLGWRRNLELVLGNNEYDGIKWPLRDGSGEYDLTKEQMAQKLEKRLRSRLYSVVHTYSGWWLPVCAWPRACIAAPCTDEARLTLHYGDSVRVTRWRRHWLFGELQKQDCGDHTHKHARGWFPRACVVLVHEVMEKVKPD